jgi:hypothetical protein
MNKIISCFIIFFLLLSVFSACYYDNEQDLYPNSTQPCDTSNVTYSGSIAPIMEANCNVCHNKTVLSGNVVTDNYADLSAVAVQLDSTRLTRAVDWTGPYQMPKGGNQLPACDLSKIRIWVKAGVKNN